MMRRWHTVLLVVALSAGLAAGPAVAAPVVGRTFRAHHMVRAAVSDGRRIYAATQSGRIQRFGIDTGRPGSDLLRLEPAPGATFAPAVYSLALSPDGRLLAAGAGDGRIYLFAVPGGRRVRALRVRGAELVQVVRFAGADALVFGLLDGSVGLLQWRTGEELYRRQAALAPVSDIRLAPEGALMAVATRTSLIRLFQVSDGAPRGVLRGHKDAVRALAFQGPGRLLSGGRDGLLLRWNLQNGTFRVLYRTGFYVDAVAWDGADRVAFAMKDYRIGVLSLRTGALEASLGGHSAFLSTLAFIGPGRLLSAGNDARILVHRL